MTQLDAVSVVVIDSRLVAVTRSGTDAGDGIPSAITAGAWTQMSITQLSTMAPSFRQWGYFMMHQSPALRVANFSANTNEYYRENFVVRLPPKSSYRHNSESIWWWGSSLGLETTRVALGPPRDRIVQQMNYIPASYSRRRQQASVKTIYVPGVNVEKGRAKFVNGQCLVDACTISTDLRDAATSHLRLMYSDSSLFLPSARVKPPGQIWVMYLLESPASSAKFYNVDDLINWTATFRWDSTIVTPYAKFVSFPLTAPKYTSPVSTLNMKAEPVVSIPPTLKNYAAGKTKMVAWFVSNCYSTNKRGEYVEELSRHLPVDVFGVCGKLSCPRSDHTCWLRLRRQYKFYISFENSNCDYYISEKFFDNALRQVYSILQ